MQSARTPASVLLIAFAACGGQQSASEAPAPADNTATLGPDVAASSAEVPLSPTDGGELVQMERLRLDAGTTLVIGPSLETEAYIYVESGRLEGHPAGAAIRVHGAARLEASEATTVVAALVGSVPSPATPQRLDASVEVVTDAPILPNAGGKLRVQIFHDQASGAANGALSLLDADADLSVPEHVHDEQAEVLFILSGDGTMIQGDDRFPLSPGRVVYVPPNTNHGYEAGTEPLRAIQIYAPPGPEQRFRAGASRPPDAAPGT